MDKGNKKERVIIKFICLLLSFSLWIYITNVENPIQTYTLRDVPVKIINTDSLKEHGLAIVPGQNFLIDLKLEGDAKNLYSVNKEGFKLVVNLGEYALKKGENNVPIEIKSMPSNINIKNNKVQSIKIMLENYISKEIKVNSKVKVTFADGSYEDSIKPTEQVVTVSGPKSSVENVSEVSMVGEIDNISTNTTKTFKLEPFDSEGNLVNGVELNETQGTLNIKISEGKVVNIEPEFTGELQDGYSLVKNEISKSRVQIFGDNKELENISVIKTEKINLNEVTSNISKKVKLIIPKNIKSNEKDVTITLEIKKESPKTKELEIPIIYEGLNENLNIKDKVENVKVTIEGYENEIAKIGKGDLKAIVNLKPYEEIGTFEVEPNIELAVDNKSVSIKSFDKVTVELIDKTS